MDRPRAPGITVLGKQGRQLIETNPPKLSRLHFLLNFPDSYIIAFNYEKQRSAECSILRNNFGCRSVFSAHNRERGISVGWGRLGECGNGCRPVSGGTSEYIRKFVVINYSC